jgi:hypothetical protein
MSGKVRIIWLKSAAGTILAVELPAFRERSFFCKMRRLKGPCRRRPQGS